MTSTRLHVDVASVAPFGVRRLACEVFLPPGPVAGLDGSATGVVFCLPGGWYSRRYFDLDVPPEIGDYSMARHLARRGLVVVTCDPPGIGDSDRPDDPTSLTPDRLADIQARVTFSVLDRMRSGGVGRGATPVTNPVPVGLGHSAGALLTVYEQARHRPFAAVVLLGFAGRGLLELLTDDERAFARDPTGLREALPRLVAQRFSDPLAPFPEHSSSIFSGGGVPEPVKQAMRRSKDRLLTFLGLTAMVPGASARELAAIDVPVFLGVGDDDITGPPHRIPADFPNARDVTLFVLEGSGHAHNVAPRRAVLWDRIAAWVRSVVLQVPDA